MEAYLPRNRNSSSKPLSQSKYNTLNLHLEVLDSCPHTCADCFVKRKNKFTGDDSTFIVNFLKGAEFTEMNEVVFAPTDVFSALNFDEVFNNDFLRENIIKLFRALTFNTTLKADRRVIIERMGKLRTLYPGKAFEFFILVDIQQFLKQDPEYMSWLKERVELLGDSNVIFTVNIPKKFTYDFTEPARIANEIFGLNFKYTPSFFRSSNTNTQIQHLMEWNRVSTINQRVINYVYDPNFGAHTYTTLVYHESKMYWAPCLIDFSFIAANPFIINSFSEINDGKYQEPTGECKDCPFAIECSSKGVVALKNHLRFQDCILPDDFKKSVRSGRY
ncbi:MAG: hypothetical protein ACLGHN_13825 [Bacteriovoracia bacterium]